MKHVLVEQWFWAGLGCLGYLISLSAMLAGLDFSIAFLACLVPLVPMALTRLPLKDRLAGVSVCLSLIHI